jgi:hypothetical protein
MNRLLNKAVFSTWLWAVLPTLLVGAFIKGVGDEYSASTEIVSIGEHDQIAFYDLNNDGVTEQIHGRPGVPLNNFPVMDLQGNFFDQWNLPDQCLNGVSALYFGNYDNDAYSEIYIFTVKDDSIFLNVNEFFEKKGLHEERIFVAKVNLVQGHIDSTIKIFGFFDRNNDGQSEMYFRINSGFALWPRYCYFYDLRNRRLQQSPATGINFNSPVLTDIDGDQRPEILSSMTASGNHNGPTPFTDYSVWLMVLDNELHFKFPPIEFPGFGGQLDVQPFRTKSGNSLAVTYNFVGAGKSGEDPGVMLVTSTGKIIKKTSFKGIGLNGQVKLCVVRRGNFDQIMLIGNDMLLLNEELQVVRRKQNPLVTCVSYFTFDFDRDGENEIFISSDRSHTVVIDSHLNVLMNLASELIGDEWPVYVKQERSGKEALFRKAGTQGLFLHLQKNQYYPAGLLVYPGVYLCFILFIGTIRKVNTRQVERRESQKRKLLTLQLQSIKSQLDPHFTFNTLNSVASLLYEQDRTAAYDTMNKFTRLLRQMLNDADKVYRTLDEELEFVVGYLELEKLRFGNKISYQITIGDGITKRELVPKMVLQTFAENAVKHGLIPKEGSGRLTIDITRDQNKINIAVDDNGIGRKQAASRTDGTGKGLKIAVDLYEVLGKLYNHSIEMKIEDKYDNFGEATGTRVEMSLTQVEG